MAFNFLKAPPATVEQLWKAIVQILFPQLEPVIISGVTIGATETVIAHGQRATPRFVVAVPRTSAYAWQSTPADAKYLYLTASGSATFDLQVIL
jgi:hypothetical protein